jgi:hypothetical protein
MMAKGLVLREVPLLCGDKPPAVRGQAPCCAGTSPLLCGDERRAGAMKVGVGVCDSDPHFSVE